MARWAWTLVLGVVVVAGCGAWSVRRGAPTAEPTPEAAPPAPYVWQEEGVFPAPPPVEAAAAGAVLDGGSAAADSLAAADAAGRLAAESPDFSVEALPAVEAPPQPTAAARTMPGFRVQVFATRALQAAERLHAEIQQRLSLPTHLDFEDPYFKVRVGDCASEAECRVLQEQLRGAGYAAAFVVPAQIVAR